MTIDFAKEARDLQVAISEHAYPAADGSADIDNNARPIIEVTLREIARRAVEDYRARGECAQGEKND